MTEIDVSFVGGRVCRIMLFGIEDWRGELVAIFLPVWDAGPRMMSRCGALSRGSQIGKVNAVTLCKIPGT